MWLLIILKELIQDLYEKNKVTILRILTLSVIITISSTNLFTIWICLELNLFSFVPLLLNKISTNEREASINYFLAQTLGSTIFLLFSVILFHVSWLMKLNITLLIFIILLKMGAAPCHYWYPSTIRIIRWINWLFYQLDKN